MIQAKVKYYIAECDNSRCALKDKKDRSIQTTNKTERDTWVDKHRELLTHKPQHIRWWTQMIPEKV